jgi:hypothetical protein
VRSSGIIIGSSEVNATSGSPADIQAAVNAVNIVGGGTVYIAAGTFHWNGETVTIPAGVSVIGAGPAGCMSNDNNWQEYTAKTILHNDAIPTSSYDVPTMFQVQGANGRPTRIANIQFEATAPSDSASEWQTQSGSAIALIGARNFRIDHCTFINFAGSSVTSSSADWAGTPTPYSAYGLVDHCVVNLVYKPSSDPTTAWQGGYGFRTMGNMRTGDGNYVDEISPFAGKYEAIPNVSLMYVEDCKFIKARHAVDTSSGGTVCARYNLIAEPAYYGVNPNSIGEFDQHGGFGTGNDAAGVLLEVYNNTIMGKPNFGTMAIRLRGGHGIVYNNIFNPPDFTHWAQVLVTLDSEACPVTHTYIWNNQYSNCELINNNGVYTENVDYFLRAPTQELDGWTYTPYPYPHPLVAE